MDRRRNPYAPGAGTAPPELAGRDDLRENFIIAVDRAKAGRPFKSMILVGLRGVGKTVLLSQMREDVREGAETLKLEAPEGTSLPALLLPELRLALLRLSQHQKARAYAERALRAVAGFVKGLKVKYQDIEVGLDLEPEPGLADNGALGPDLESLLKASGTAAQEASTALVLFVDELQYVPQEQLAALVVALHEVHQARLPVVLAGAGLPQLRSLMGEAKSYTERMFDFPDIGPLDWPAARLALAKPAEDLSVAYEEDALRQIFRITEGYPYFVQEWGKQSWDAAAQSPISAQDVEIASRAAVAALDASFFRVRFDRLTPAERRYLRAMAELGPGPHRSGDIAAKLGRNVTGLGPVRNKLIIKGMVWSPNYGDTAFTVPLFDQFMLRIMPDAGG